MKDILQEIALKTKERVEAQKAELPLNTMKSKAMARVLIETDNQGNPNGSAYSLGVPSTYPFFQALCSPGIHLICEAKKASPSKGVIAEDFPYVEIAKDYEAGGASAISVLTEPTYFLGSNSYLIDIKKTVSIPVLRKDFIVDEYQIYETKALGADACLLICAILDEDTLDRYLQIAYSLGLSALVETHNEEEIKMALRCGAQIIGVNNRDLTDFSVDVSHSASLRSLVPENIVFVAESGINSKEQVAKLKEDGVNAALIGETFMRAKDRKTAVAEYAAI